MKKVFGLFLSLIAFMGLPACDAEDPGNFKKPNPEESMCLTFVSSGESTIALIKEGEPFEITLEYSVDGDVWEPYTIGETLELADGGELMFRAGEEGNDKFSAGYEDYYRFVISGKVDSKGNVMSLLDRDCKADSAPEAGFIYLFANCDGLVSAPVLPAKNLAPGCYSSMFYGCTSLTETPALPATELAMMCYYCMFLGCTSLTKAPALPAMEMAASCYLGLFSDCTSLTKAPALPATELGYCCYAGMFNGCTSLTEAPVLPAMKLSESCYAGMFNGCTSLTEAPELSATELADFCYGYMFCFCTSLTKAPALPATGLAEGCYFSMFNGCTNLTEAPVLPATELAESCYSNMFDGCTSLNYVKALFTDKPSKESTKNWLRNVSHTGTFVKSKDATWDVRGSNGIPEGWTVVIE